MSASWNVTRAEDGADADYFLLNESNTAIRLSRRFKAVDVAGLMAKMEEAGVPPAYASKVRQVYFTLLRNTRDLNIEGDYLEGVIRVSCMTVCRDRLHRILVHELGHHVDEEEDISGRDDIVAEFKSSAKHLEDKYAKKGVGEYVAVSFEVFYFGEREEVRRFKKENPRVYAAIRSVHRRYSARS